MLNEIATSELSDIEFKKMVIMKLNEFTENYPKLQGIYKELTVNYTSMKKDIEITNEIQEEVKNTISELQNTVEGVKIRLDEADDQISELEDKVQKTPQKRRKRKNGSKRMKRD